MYWEAPAIFGFIGFSLVMAYISMNLEQEHFIAKFLFLIASFSTMVIGSRLISQIVEINNAPENILVITDLLFWLLTFITTILVLYLCWYVISKSFASIKEIWYKIMKFKK